MRAAFLASAMMLLSMAAPAVAADQPDASAQEAWSIGADSVRANGAGVLVPQSAGGLSLIKTGEATARGEGLDNYAQFTSADGVVQATLFVYRPGHADAAVSAFMTDKAIREHFGPAVRRTAFGLAPAGGEANAALRSTYDIGNGALVTSAAMVHAGQWLLKIRVTATADRADDVAAGMDALLAGLRFDAGATPQPLVARSIDACPAQDSAQAQPAGKGDGLCLRGAAMVGSARYDILQEAGAAGKPGTIIVPLDDAGGMMRFVPVASGTGYQLMIDRIGGTESHEVYDRAPTSQQIAAIIDRSSDEDPAALLSALSRRGQRASRGGGTR